MILTTGMAVEGQPVKKYLDVVTALAIMGVHFGRDIKALGRRIVGATDEEARDRLRGDRGPAAPDEGAVDFTARIWMPLPISLARPTCDRRNVAPRIPREAQRGGAMVVQAHPEQAPEPALERPVLRSVEAKRRPATLHLFTYVVGNALAWILWGAITLSTDSWYWWPIVPFAGWTLVLSLRLWHVYRS